MAGEKVQGDVQEFDVCFKLLDVVDDEGKSRPRPRGGTANMLHRAVIVGRTGWLAWTITMVRKEKAVRPRN